MYHSFLPKMLITPALSWLADVWHRKCLIISQMGETIGRWQHEIHHLSLKVQMMCQEHTFSEQWMDFCVNSRWVQVDSWLFRERLAFLANRRAVYRNQQRRKSTYSAVRFFVAHKIWTFIWKEGILGQFLKRKELLELIKSFNSTYVSIVKIFSYPFRFLSPKITIHPKMAKYSIFHR